MRAQDDGVTQRGRTPSHRRSPRRSRRRTGLVVLAILLAVGIVAGTLPPVQVRLAAALTVAEALDLPVTRPFAPEVDRREHVAGGVEGVLYEPDGAPAPVVLLVPGAVPAGVDDRRVVQVAQAVARSGRQVFVPELEVYGEDLVTRDVERLVHASLALSEAAPGGVALVGISFGGSLALLAAADERLEGRVAVVATFGAYLDLVGVLQAATTGEALVDGQRIAWDADPLAETVVREHLTELLPEEQRPAVLAVLAGEVEPDALPPSVRAAYDLLVNDDPERTYVLAEQLPAEVRDRIAAVSPGSVTDRLESVPIVAMHAVDDPVIPYSELLRLGAALPHAQLITLVSFDHVGLDAPSPRAWLRALGDLRQVWRFSTAVLDAGGG